jgi:four helix bundle protein
MDGERCRSSMNEKSEVGLTGLQVWQRAMTYADRIYKEVLPALPAEEKWAMRSQPRRAAQSIPANFAEGHGRYYYQDNIRFCYVARGSLQEAFTFLSLPHDIGYLSQKIDWFYLIYRILPCLLIAYRITYHSSLIDF